MDKGKKAMKHFVSIIFKSSRPCLNLALHQINKQAKNDVDL